MTTTREGHPAVVDPAAGSAAKREPGPADPCSGEVVGATARTATSALQAVVDHVDPDVHWRPPSAARHGDTLLVGTGFHEQATYRLLEHRKECVKVTVKLALSDTRYQGDKKALIKFFTAFYDVAGAVVPAKQSTVTKAIYKDMNKTDLQGETTTTVLADRNITVTTMLDAPRLLYRLTVTRR